MSAMPEWPQSLKTLLEQHPNKKEVVAHVVEQDARDSYVRMGRDAALARLRVASNRGYLQHLDWCSWEYKQGCTCGLDELLATLLPPGEGR